MVEVYLQVSMGCRLGFKVFWNTRLNLFMTKDYAEIDSIYAFVRKFKL
jgi:hypothetical protein